MTGRVRGAVRGAVVTGLLLVGGAAVGEARLAVFTDGRVLKVEDAYLRDASIVLVLPAGGELVVPAVRVERVVADEVEEVVVAEAVLASVAAPAPCNLAFVDEELPADTPFSQYIVAAARDADLHPRLLATLVRAESAFDPFAMSRAGAAGLTQLMPAAAADRGVFDVFNPADNLRGGALHLRAMVDRFGDLRLALAAYNAGATTVERYGEVPPYNETRQYVRRIYGEFCKTAGPAG